MVPCISFPIPCPLVKCNNEFSFPFLNFYRNPSSSFKHRMLYSELGLVRNVFFSPNIWNIKYSVHTFSQSLMLKRYNNMFLLGCSEIVKNVFYFLFYVYRDPKQNWGSVGTEDIIAYIYVSLICMLISILVNEQLPSDTGEYKNPWDRHRLFAVVQSLLKINDASHNLLNSIQNSVFIVL